MRVSDVRTPALTETVANPMHPKKLDGFDTARLNNAPRCQARSKRSGLPCKAPAVWGYRVCRMHGAREGAPTRMRNGNYRHGQATNDARRRMARINYLVECLGGSAARKKRHDLAKSYNSKCPLSGVKRTLIGNAAMSAYDPKRTWWT